MGSFFRLATCILSGPGKLLPFGVRKNPKIRPQIHMVGALKSAHSDKGHHVSSKKGNTYFFFAPSHSSRFLHKREAGLLKYTVICILFCTINFREHYLVVLQFDIFGQ